jgi:hypothetical protein
MERRRKKLARIAFALDVLVCGIWAYSAATSMVRMLSAGGGGIAGVSTGAGVVLYTVAPPIMTIALARASGSTRLATRWRNAHLATMLALVVLPMMASSLSMMLVSIAVFLPVQVFFVIGALAIWYGSPRNRPDTSSEASA